MEIKDIKELILTINGSDIASLELVKGDFKLSISKDKSNKEIYSYNTPIIGEKIQESKEEVGLELTEADENLYTIKSPMVGVYYEASSPEAEPFIKLGSQIEKGQTLCIIEAMKIMNEIEAEISGEVLEILVADGDTIEYGQDLMRIRRN